MPIFYHTVFVLARLCRARRRVVVLFPTSRQALPNGTLNRKVATGLRLQMAVVYLHLHNPHVLDLACELLYLLLGRESIQSFN